MLIQFKMYLYAIAGVVITSFIAVFKYRGSKVLALQAKVDTTRKVYETAIKAAKFEARNKTQNEERQKDEKPRYTSTPPNGKYTL